MEKQTEIFNNMIQPLNFYAVGNQKVRRLEAILGKTSMTEPSLHDFHPNVKGEMDTLLEQIVKQEPFMGNEFEGEIFEQSQPCPAIAKREMFVEGLDMNEMDSDAEPYMYDEDEPYWPLSGKPYFDVILLKSQATYPYKLVLPRKITTQLPSDSVPAVITYCGKKWEMVYKGDIKEKRFDSDWSNFIVDNKLKVGDGCVFELTENSSTGIKFRAQLLKCPADVFLEQKVGTSESPIVIE